VPEGYVEPASAGREPFVTYRFLPLAEDFPVFI
jgi:hypothetical protein